jgi:NAD-dependent deacetylase
MSYQDSEQDPRLLHARRVLAASDRIVVLTGAGISTESGIPDFRGPEGVWTRNPEAEKMATLQHYLADSELRERAWRSKLDSSARGAKPNAGHRALVDLEDRDKLHTLITQNVDGLHQDAGTSPERVIEIHGTARSVRCMSCDYRAAIGVALERVRSGEADPPCPRCGGILKSATISFGQGLVAEDLARCQQAALECDLMFAIGTTLAVFPIASVVPVALRAGAKVMILNAEPTEMDDLAEVVLRGRIGEVLPALL